MIIVWPPAATRDRFDQLDYIAQDNPLAAAEQDEEIERQVDMLVQYPKRGRTQSSPPAGLAALIRSDIAMYRQAARQAGIEPP